MLGRSDRLAVPRRARDEYSRSGTEQDLLVDEPNLNIIQSQCLKGPSWGRHRCAFTGLSTWWKRACSVLSLTH